MTAPSSLIFHSFSTPMSGPAPSFAASICFSEHIISAPMKSYIDNHARRGMGRRSIAELAGTWVMVSVPAKRKIFNHYTLYKPIFTKRFLQRRSGRSKRQCYFLIPLHLLLFASCFHQPWRCQTVTAVYELLTSAGEGSTSLLLIKFVKSSIRATGWRKECQPCCCMMKQDCSCSKK